MGYAIVGGIGLAVGIGLLIWGLFERAARAKAVKRATDAEADARAKAQMAESLTNALNQHRDQTLRDEKQLEVLRDAVKELRKRLTACQDPQAVAAWLDVELADVDV